MMQFVIFRMSLSSVRRGNICWGHSSDPHSSHCVVWWSEVKVIRGEKPILLKSNCEVSQSLTSQPKCLQNPIRKQRISKCTLFISTSGRCFHPSQINLNPLNLQGLLHTRSAKPPVGEDRHIKNLIQPVRFIFNNLWCTKYVYVSCDVDII